MSTKFRSNRLKSCYNYVKELEEILSSLEHLLSRRKELGLKVAGRNRSRRSDRHTPVAHESDFCGREDIKETIIQSLRSADVRREKIGDVIPIIGAGGIGKTTLAQIIYQHPDVKKHFPEARAWVTVSTEFDLPVITKRIIRQVSHSSQIDGNVDGQVLLHILSEALEGKKFLLVLDDVWSEDRGEWNILKSCFKSGQSGSKIIVTTRSAKVASIMAPNQQHHFLRELPEKDCLKLFAQTVFVDDEERDANPDLQEIGEKIVEKCTGVPLSVISVAGILCGDRDPEYWETILKSTVWELLQQGSKHIIPSLWLSYLYLPSEIKPCFAYCSIFPKDYEFEIGEVVRLWMAEGFLENEARKRGITMEEVGMRYLEELISRSLFQRSEGWIDPECFIMHDLVHDLAMNVSGEFCFCLEGEKNLRDLSCKTRYLSWDMETRDVKKSEDLSKARRLHSFVVLEGSTEIGGDILTVLEEMEGGCLRVLSLPSLVDAMKSLPDSIGNLKHLRYLNLSRSGVRKLPESVGTLYNLQTLNLSFCQTLTQLPDSIGDLKHLRYLNLCGSVVRKLPESVCTLYNLQTLNLSCCYTLTQLPDSIGDLKHLRYLNLSRSGVRKLPESVGTLYNLQALNLSFCQTLTQLPDSIGDLKHLRYLNLSETRLKKLPDLVGTLYSMQTLLLSNCEYLTQLPGTMGRLINLRHLDTKNSPLEEMPPHMRNLTKLQTLSDFVVGKRGSSIRDLGALHDLNGELRISGLQNVDDVLKGSLEDKKNLSKLVLEWNGQTDDSRDSRKGKRVLDALQPHANLKELFIYHYGGTSFPDWALFSKIERMHLNGCRNCLFLPSLGRLPSLKEIKMKGFHKLETIDDGFYGNDSDSPFKSLEVLHFEDMPEWKRWSVIEVPRLKELQLKGCPKLVGGLPNSNTITILDIYGCESLDFPENHLYPSLESLKTKQSCGSIRRLSLEHLPKLNELELTGLECLVELTGESSNEVKRLFIEKCPKLEFMGNGRYGSLKDLKIEKCEALKSIPLDYFPKLNWFTLEDLECLVELTGELPNVLEWLTIKKCPKLEFMGTRRHGSLKALKIEKCEVLNWESPKDFKSLSIKECPKLEFMWNGGYGSVKNLEIEKCQPLKSIPLDYFPKLNKLDLKGLECLIELTGESPKDLKRLSIKECPKLEFTRNGGYGSLQNLEIEKCEALKSIPLCYFPKLNMLTLRYCQNFESFRFAEEPPLVLESLTCLVLNNLPKLLSLPQQMHRLLPSLDTLRVISCGEIESWPEGGLPSNLDSLSIMGCKNLAAQFMHWDLQVTCLKSLEIDGCGEELLDSFPPKGFLPTSLTSLSILKFPRLKTLNIHAFQHLEYLYLYKCNELQCLPEESLPNSLSSFEIYYCPLLERRYRKESGEGWHKISHIPRVWIGS